MAGPKKRIRGKRARARQRERQGHDLRSRYRQGDLPATANIAVATIEDPYSSAGHVDRTGNLVAEAQLEPVRRQDGSISEGAPAWTPPRPPLLTVIRSLREDAIGRMHARHQVDEAQYQAARAYQQLHETATIGNLSPATMRPRVDGGRIPDPVSDVRMAATKRLRSVESTLRGWHGDAGLSLTRAVLTNGNSVEKTAREFGAASTREVLSWGWLFRKCLDVLARALGLANSAQRPRRLHPFNGAGAPDLRDPAMHAGGSELSDPGLRRERPNGGHLT